MKLFKLAEFVELSLDISKSEKDLARKVIFKCNKLSKKLESFNIHLNILYNPFKKFEDITQDSVLKYRGTLRRYRDKIKENFGEIKLQVFKIINDLKIFEIDSSVSEIINSFDNSFGDVSDGIDALLNVMDNWRDSNYRSNVIKTMEQIKKQIAQVDKIIFDRIIEHINTNILANNWIDNVSDELNLAVNEHEPFIAKLKKEREEALNNILR